MNGKLFRLYSTVVVQLLAPYSSSPRRTRLQRHTLVMKNSSSPSLFTPSTLLRPRPHLASQAGA